MCQICRCNDFFSSIILSTSLVSASMVVSHNGLIEYSSSDIGGGCLFRTVLKKRPPPISDEEQRSTEDNDALSHNYGQDTAIYCRTTSIGCYANQATSVQTVEPHHKM